MNKFRFSKAVRQALSRAAGLRLLNRCLHAVEELVLPPADDPLEHPPIFIIGAPRSGSTLLYQALVNRFQLTYTANFTCLFYGAMSFVEKWFGPSWKKGTGVDYESEMGVCSGMWAPSECGQFWYRWFPKDVGLTRAEDLDEERLNSLRKVVAAFGNAGRRPVLFKNLYCTLRLGPLSRAIPEAVFLVVRRDPVSIASSILKCRKKIHGNYNDWWSVRPKEYDQLKHLSPGLQVIGQVKSIYARIESNAMEIGEDRFLTIDYEDFCSDTHRELERVKEFANSNGVELQVRGKVPPHFRKSSSVIPNVDPALQTELHHAVKLDLDTILNRRQNNPVEYESIRM